MKIKQNRLLISIFAILVGATILALSLSQYLNLAPALISSVSWNL